MAEPMPESVALIDANEAFAVALAPPGMLRTQGSENDVALLLVGSPTVMSDAETFSCVGAAVVALAPTPTSPRARAEAGLRRRPPPPPLPLRTCELIARARLSAKALRARTPASVVREKVIGDWPVKSVENETKGAEARDGGAQENVLQTSTRGDVAESGGAGRRWAQMASAAGTFPGEAAETPHVCVTAPPPHCPEQPAASLTQPNEHETEAPGARGETETVDEGVRVAERVGLREVEAVRLDVAVDVSEELAEPVADEDADALAVEVRVDDAVAVCVADFDAERVAVAAEDVVPGADTTGAAVLEADTTGAAVLGADAIAEPVAVLDAVGVAGADTVVEPERETELVPVSEVDAVTVAVREVVDVAVPVSEVVDVDVAVLEVVAVAVAVPVDVDLAVIVAVSEFEVDADRDGEPLCDGVHADDGAGTGAELYVTVGMPGGRSMNLTETLKPADSAPDSTRR